MKHINKSIKNILFMWSLHFHIQTISEVFFVGVAFVVYNNVHCKKYLWN